MSRFCGRMALTAMLVLSSLCAFGQANQASAAPEYVKICSMYGAGFYYIPGTDTCIKLSGYVRLGSYVEQPVPANMSGYRIRTAAYDARQQTCYGAVQAARVAALPQSNDCIALNFGGTYQIFTPGQPIDRAYIGWSGLYAGVNGGWMRGSRDVSATELFNGDAFFTAPFGTRTVQGGFGGGQVGYNWQKGSWVVGVEADVQGGSIDGMSRATYEPYVGPGTYIRVNTNECISVFGTARVRVGYAWGGALVYGTAGLAVAEPTLRIGERDSFRWDARATSSTIQAGVAAGFGGEYQVYRNWSVKAEYLYLNFGDGTIKAREFNGAVPTATDIWSSSRLQYNIVRVGVNYRFGSGTPVF
jgi:outer membrane immunogenic protein